MAATDLSRSESSASSYPWPSLGYNILRTQNQDPRVSIVDGAKRRSRRRHDRREEQPSQIDRFEQALGSRSKYPGYGLAKFLDNEPSREYWHPEGLLLAEDAAERARAHSPFLPTEPQDSLHGVEHFNSTRPLVLKLHRRMFEVHKALTKYLKDTNGSRMRIYELDQKPLEDAIFRVREAMMGHLSSSEQSFYPLMLLGRAVAEELHATESRDFWQELNTDPLRWANEIIGDPELTSNMFREASSDHLPNDIVDVSSNVASGRNYSYEVLDPERLYRGRLFRLCLELIEIVEMGHTAGVLSTQRALDHGHQPPQDQQQILDTLRGGGLLSDAIGIDSGTSGSGEFETHRDLELAVLQTIAQKLYHRPLLQVYYGTSSPGRHHLDATRHLDAIRQVFDKIMGDVNWRFPYHCDTATVIIGQLQRDPYDAAAAFTQGVPQSFPRRQYSHIPHHHEVANAINKNKDDAIAVTTRTTSSYIIVGDRSSRNKQRQLRSRLSSVTSAVTEPGSLQGPQGLRRSESLPETNHPPETETLTDGNATIIECSKCPSTFSGDDRKTNHRKHDRKYHSDTRKTFTCNMCGKDFNDKSNRTRHELLNCSERPQQEPSA